jgi:hypothetical protein
VIVGGGALNLKASRLLLVGEVPVAVVTVTSTLPGVCEGEVAVIDVELFTVKFDAAVPPKETPGA